MKAFNLFLLVLIATCVQSCESFLDVDLPKAQISSSTVFNTDDTAIAAMSGVYNQLVYGGGFASGNEKSITFLAGTSSDELNNYFSQTNNIEFFQNELLPNNALNTGIWGSCYTIIYSANSILEGINSPSLTSETKRQLEGEAKFIRAFCHFYLVNLYGDIPIVKTTDYTINKRLPRSLVEDVYDQIILDLLRAKELLSNEYVTGDRIRVNKAAAAALLARVYLYRSDWLNAEAQATSVITNPQYDLVPLNQVFLANSPEAILQFINPQYPGRTNEGNYFILNSDPNYVALSNTLINSFEPGDQRLTSWVGSFPTSTTTFYYPHKFKNKLSGAITNSEHSMVLRLGELFLIRAEARAKQGKLLLAIADLNEIRERAGLVTLSVVEGALTLSEVEGAIDQERKVELFAEWGHRWLDLKRSAQANVVLPGIKQFWDDTDVLYPIPESDMLNNPNLRPQNDGY